MNIPIKYSGVAALAACVSFSLSSCGSDSSADTQACLLSLDNVQIVNLTDGDLADDELRILSIDCRATSTGSTTETGTLDLKMDSISGEWIASNVSYSYNSSNGSLTIYAGTVTCSNTGTSLSYADTTVKITTDTSMSDVLSSNVDFEQCNGYQSASTVLISGDFDGDGALEDDDTTDGVTYSATLKIVGQSIMMTKTSN